MTLPSFFIILASAATGFALAWFIKNREIKLTQPQKEDQKNAFKVIAEEVAGEVMEKSVNKTIKDLNEKVNKFEQERGAQFNSISERIKQVLETGTKMSETATTLETVLSSSNTIRGSWGEDFLKKLLEDAGFIGGVNLETQETIQGDDVSLRPDFIVKLPGDISLAIDSKASLGEFYKAVKEKDETKKSEHIQKFVSNLRTIIKNLSSKEYQKYLDKKIPYVVMFIPGEAAIRAAFEYDADLYREAQEKKVMLASPFTIMPLILLIAHAWKQYKSNENAMKLSSEIADLGNRLGVFFGHVHDMGSSIAQTTKKFNAAVGSWDTKILPKIEKINDLGGHFDVREGLGVVEEEPRISKKLKTGELGRMELELHEAED